MVFGGFEGVRWNRKRRRILVAVDYLWVGTISAFFMAAPTLEDLYGGWIWTLFLVALVPVALVNLLSFTALKASIQNLTDKKATELDERQESVWHRAHYLSYKILGTTLLAGMGYGVIAFQLFPGQLWLPAGDQFFFLWAILFFLFSTLPTAVAAWTEPDLEPEGGF